MAHEIGSGVSRGHLLVFVMAQRSVCGLCVTIMDSLCLCYYMVGLTYQAVNGIWFVLLAFLS